MADSILPPPDGYQRNERAVAAFKSLLTAKGISINPLQADPVWICMEAIAQILSDPILSPHAMILESRGGGE